MKNIQHSMFIRTSILSVLLAAIFSVSSCASHPNRVLNSGEQFKVVGPVYLSAIYLNLNKPKLTKKLATGGLTAVRFSGPEVAFQHRVPVGTMMTILSPAPKAFRLDNPFFPDRYFIRLDRVNFPRELDITIELNGGIAGGDAGLNRELFEWTPPSIIEIFGHE